ncbi:MAG: ChbG/HpnK family deacetylase, partial [Gemmatimonadales bacterium]
LDTHLDALQSRPEFFDVYLELAVEFRLPIRLSGARTQSLVGFPFRNLAADEGVVFPDDLVTASSVGARKVLLDTIPRLQPGVTELALHPAVRSPELEALAPDADARVDDHALLVDDVIVREALEEAGVTLLGYRALRDLMAGA